MGVMHARLIQSFSITSNLILEGSVGDSPSLALSVVGWRVYHKIGWSARMCGSYRRVVVATQSTKLGLFCRIDKMAQSFFVRQWRRNVLGIPSVDTKLTESRSKMQKLLKNLVGLVSSFNLVSH